MKPVKLLRGERMVRMTQIPLAPHNAEPTVGNDVKEECMVVDTEVFTGVEKGKI